MIDQSDVANALVNQIVTAVYPNGTGQPSITNKPVRVFPGWPDPKTLQPDLTTNGATQISVYPQKIERNTSGLIGDWQLVSMSAPTLAASITGNAVTISGTPSVPQNVMIAVNGTPYSYGVQANDTLTSIAAGLAALISVDTAATASGATVTISSNPRLKAAISVQGLAVRELRRQAKQFQICVWAPTNTVRDQIAAAIDVLFAKAPHLPLPYGCAARVTYKGSYPDDSEQTAGIYRRDVFFEIEYPTVETENEMTIVGVVDSLTPAATVSDDSEADPALLSLHVTYEIN
jgi:hypothetical protein